MARYQHRVMVRDVAVSNALPFVLIAGPCQIESLDMSLRVADVLQHICASLGIGFIFKSSYDKANRTAVGSVRGVGAIEGLSILRTVQERVGCPVTSDVHDVDEVRLAAQVLDLIQIPALLSRQTDLLMAAGRSGKPVNVKKGQFMDAAGACHAADKVRYALNPDVMLTERGTTFGYNDIVADMRNIPLMKKGGTPVIFDATHTVQSPGGKGNASGGNRADSAPLANAAVAVGVAGLFLEVHEDPESAPSDGPVMTRLSSVFNMLTRLKDIDSIVKQY